MTADDTDRLDAWSFDLPEAAIAQHPPEERGASRLLQLGKAGVTHHAFADLPDLLAPGDLLVLNDTRVLPARIHAARETGAQVEVLFCDPLPDGRWTAMVRPGRKAREGDTLRAGAHRLVVEAVREDGLRIIRADEDIRTVMAEAGSLPVPPYIREVPDEPERYQTVYGTREGSVAAPTAGLHLTDDLLAKLGEQGIGITRLTLHVGLGTFLPVKADRLSDHRMHPERYEVPEEAARAIARTRSAGGRVIAVGTTSTRTLEAVAAEHGSVVPCSGTTSLFIRPGFPFRAIDGLITNFHLPKSTLVVLVGALAENLGLGGRESVLDAYAQAIASGYRFFSFGDAMLLLRQRA